MTTTTQTQPITQPLPYPCLLTACSGISVTNNDSSPLSTHSQFSLLTVSDFVTQMQKMKKISLVYNGPKAQPKATWKKSEVITLQELVLKYGTDFDVIGKMMNKPRNQIKRKFNAMAKQNNSFGFAKK